MIKSYILLCVISALASNYGIDGLQFCADLNPQNHVDISKIEGLWFGSEVLLHSSSNSTNSNDGENQDSCVVVHIRERRTEQYNHVKLIWEERGQISEYNLQYNTIRRGVWTRDDIVVNLDDAERNASSTQTQFTVTVQVIKAVGDYLVLTFCQTMPTEQLFTVILARKPNTLTADEIRSVKRLLTRRGLSTSSSREVCSPVRSLQKAEQQQRSYLFSNIKKW